MVKPKTKMHHSHKKRHGHHQKRNRTFASVYFPYLPIALVFIANVFWGSFQPLRGTLAYATSMSHSALLSATNSHRASNGKTTLFINQSLSSAAQTKANDMAERNYWSHNTPTGEEPWVFIDNTGYKYLKAGENLAYGFATSEDTVVGWMNSPSHRTNMLDDAYSEVGFGYTNSANFNGAGQQTIVVAMYAKPQTLAATSPATQPASANPAPGPQPVAAQTEEVKPVPVPALTVEQNQSEPRPVSTDIKITAEIPPQEIARVQTLTGGSAPWTLYATTMLAAAAVLFMLIRHSLAFRHLIRDSQRFVAHHPLIDATLLSVVLLAIILSQTVGIIL